MAPAELDPLRKSAAHATDEKPTVLAHATNPLGHVSSAVEAMAVLLSVPALPGCTLVGKGPPQTVRFAEGTEPGLALKLPPWSKFHEAMGRRKGDAVGVGVPERVVVTVAVPLGVVVDDGVHVAELVGDSVISGVLESDAPRLGVLLGVGAALGVGDAETGRPTMATLSMRNVDELHDSCEKRQQKLGASEAFPGNGFVAKPEYHPDTASDTFGEAPA